MDDAAIRDLFADLGPVRTRRMFGGHGIYAGDLMFALETGGEIFLKVDGESIEAFRAAGSRPFVHENGGRPTQMSYWLLPDAALDDPAEAARWGRAALDAAARNRAAKARTGRARR